MVLDKSYETKAKKQNENIAAEKPNKIEPKHADGVMKPINHTAWKTNIEISVTKYENKKINLNCNKLNNAKTMSKSTSWKWSILLR